MKRGGDIHRRNRIGESRIRQLKPGEPLPEGEPRRYTSDARGYVRLRWKVGKGEYVETYEHRLIAGVPPAHVHHENEDKTDNRPSNLHVLSPEEHHREHGVRASVSSKRATLWGGAKSQAAFDKREGAKKRRAVRAQFLADLKALYDAAVPVKEIAARVGRHPSTVKIGLRSVGVVGRTAYRTVTAGVTSRVRSLVQARAGMACERCGRNLSWSPGQTHHRRPRRMGGDRRPETNQAANLIYLCGTCHEWTESNRTKARGLGLLLSDRAMPAAVPVTCRHGRVLLADDGTWKEAPCESS